MKSRGNVCSWCGSFGAKRSTCPLNPHSKNHDINKHPAAKLHTYSKNRVVKEQVAGNPLDQDLLRLVLDSMIRRGEIKLDDCEFPADFNDIKLTTKKSGVSNTFISFGTLNTPNGIQDVALKMSFKPRDPDIDNSLDVERRIYTEITNPLLLNGITPHVIFSYGVLRCNNFMNVLQRHKNEPYYRDLYAAIKNNHALQKEYNLDQLRVLVTERAKGSTLLDTIPKLSFLEIKPILFQIVYTLLVFEEIGLRHNDLHAENIFLEETPKPITNYYKVGNLCYKITSKYQVRMYDFDRGAKVTSVFNPTEIQNTLLLDKPKYFGYCKQMGQCPTASARLDLFTVLYYMYYFTKNTYLDRLILSIIPLEILHNKNPRQGKGSLSWAGYLCLCDNDVCDTCTVPNESNIMHPRDIILNKFSEFVVKCPNEYWQLPSEYFSMDYKLESDMDYKMESDMDYAMTNQ